MTMLRTQFRHVNPARAGMILFLYPAAKRISGKPRASGDDPISTTIPREIYE